MESGGVEIAEEVLVGEGCLVKNKTVVKNNIGSEID